MTLYVQPALDAPHCVASSYVRDRGFLTLCRGSYETVVDVRVVRPATVCGGCELAMERRAGLQVEIDKARARAVEELRRFEAGLGEKEGE